MSEGTKYNFLSCGGIALANAIDCLAAIRQVVYDNPLEFFAQSKNFQFTPPDTMRQEEAVV